METKSEVYGPENDDVWMLWFNNIMKEELRKTKKYELIKDNLLKKHGLKISDEDVFKKVYNLK